MDVAGRAFVRVRGAGSPLREHFTRKLDDRSRSSTGRFFMLAFDLNQCAGATGGIDMITLLEG
jgi:hypothetical protein